MTEWEPATDAEIAMRNALRTDDQESYFRILAGVDLLLPVSADALAGLAPLGWGTWSTGGRTHVLAFTSPSALQACLADYTGSARRVAYAELAETWPNLEWWLAVNPGLPIEGYLPAWFVAQLSRGDLRLPTRGPGPAGSNAPNRIQDLHAAATLAATAAAQGYNASAQDYAAQDYAAPDSGGPIQGGAAASTGTAPSGDAAYGDSRPGSPAYGGSAPGSAGSGSAASGSAASGSAGSGSAGSGSGGSVSGGAAYGGGASGGAAYGSAPGGAAYGGASGGAAYGSAPGGAARGDAASEGSAYGGPGQGRAGSGGAVPTGSGAGANAGASGPGAASSRFVPPSGGSASPGGPGSASSAPEAGSAGQVGPGGLPLRTPGAVLPSGLPSRVPGAPAGQDGGIPGGQFNGFDTSPADRSAQPGGYSGQPDPRAQPGDQPRGYSGQPDPRAQPGDRGRPGGGGGAPAGGVRPSSGVPGRPGDVPAAYRPPTVPTGDPGGPGVPVRSTSGPSALNALGSRPGQSPTTERSSAPGGPGNAPPPLPRPDAPLPTRTPMAQTPPLPAHIPPPPDTDDSAAAGTAPGQAVSGGTGAISTKLTARDGAISAKLAGGQAGSGPATAGRAGSEQAPSPEERSASMAAAAQAFAGNRGPGSTQPPTTQQPSPQEPSTGKPAGGAPQPQPGLAPPVIPGAGGAGRSTTGPVVRASAGGPQTPSPAPARSAPAEPQSRPDPNPDARATTDPGTGTGSGSGDAGYGGIATATGAGRGEGVTGSGRGEGGTGYGDAGATGSRPGGFDSGSAADGYDEEFDPANEVERDLLHAVEDGSTDSFLSTLLLATVLVPVANNSRPGSAPGESGFAFRTEEIDGDRFLVVFTSRDRLAEHFAEPTRTVGVRFVDLIRNWPDPAWSFAVNPTSPIGARYPGPQVIALASWAVEAGLGGDPMDTPVAQPPRPAEPTAQLTVMQKAVPAEQIDYYLERGYDRVAGFVHRAGEVEHLRSPGELFAALGLLYDGSPYQADAKEAFVLRWPAHRPSLYRIPYGGQSEQALRAMDGWVIERPPFRGNGFAPGEGKDVIAEFKVDSVRLPHGAQLWRIADGAEQMIAVFDCDVPVWRRVGEQ